MSVCLCSIQKRRFWPFFSRIWSFCSAVAFGISVVNARVLWCKRTFICEWETRHTSKEAGRILLYAGNVVFFFLVCFVHLLLIWSVPCERNIKQSLNGNEPHQSASLLISNSRMFGSCCTLFHIIFTVCNERLRFSTALQVFHKKTWMNKGTVLRL